MSHVTVGPTAVMALMAYEYVQKGGPEYAIILSFLAGCLELIAGLFNLGEHNLYIHLVLYTAYVTLSYFSCY